MKRRHKTIGIAILFTILSLYFLISYINGGSGELKKNEKESIFVDSNQEAIETKNKEIVVEIKGEVVKPDIYTADEDSIIEDIIKKAGGLTHKADASKINRAELLKNHQLIVIPSIDDKNVAQANSTTDKQGKININTATLEELDSLPGIGATRAKDIIAYREANGSFKAIEDIKNIKGIGNAAFEKLKDKITI
jgi:competence protein ComEA